jgi:hypothetical protein
MYIISFVRPDKEPPQKMTADTFVDMRFVAVPEIRRL